MTDHTPDCSCTDYGRSRRTFLRNAMAVSGGALATTVFGDTFTQTAYGATNGNVLVVLSLRGGCDGLSLVVPHGDPQYAANRPNIKIDTGPLLQKDALFGLHPALKPLQPMWQANKFAAIHATGLRLPNRSHFSAIEEIEDADVGSSARTGWINRLIGLDTLRSPLEAISVGSSLMPTSLYGPQPSLAAAQTNTIELSGANSTDGKARRRRALTELYRSTNGPLGVGARAALETTSILEPKLAGSYQPSGGARYPAGDLGKAMSDSARLIKAGVGVEVVTVDFGSWDMHSNVGNLDSGMDSFAGMTSNLASSLAAFFTDLGTVGNRVTVVTLTEFGRRLTENGARGLDHGWGNATLLMGAGVKGGKYYGNWPGLDPATSDGDLAVTTDYRSVLSEILTSRFNVSTSAVFPGFTPESLGLMA